MRVRVRLTCGAFDFEVARLEFTKLAQEIHKLDLLKAKGQVAHVQGAGAAVDPRRNFRMVLRGVVWAWAVVVLVRGLVMLLALVLVLLLM